jgi:hypothetical protein
MAPTDLLVGDAGPGHWTAPNHQLQAIDHAHSAAAVQTEVSSSGGSKMGCWPRTMNCNQSPAAGVHYIQCSRGEQQQWQQHQLDTTFRTMMN